MGNVRSEFLGGPITLITLLSTPYCCFFKWSMLLILYVYPVNGKVVRREDKWYGHEQEDASTEDVRWM